MVTSISSRHLRSAYQEDQLDNWLRLSKICAVVALALVPAGMTLDYLVYPERFGEFFGYRIACDVAIVAAFGLYFIDGLRRNVRAITFFWMIAIQVMICYMIFVTEGANSTYYAGLNLAVLALGIVLPASWPEVLFYVAVTLALYFVACIFHTDTYINVRVVYNNSFFLVLTGGITALATYFNEQRRFNEFRLRYELKQKNLELAELDRLKSQFFANVSHELRTPLTLILSPVQELVELRKDVPESVRAPLRIVQDNAYRLLRLVNDLLEIMRLEEGADNLTRGPVALNRIVEEQAAGSAHVAKTKGVRLERALHDGPLVVAGDVGALERIVVNLLNNAVKFTERGGWVKVSTRLVSRADGDRAVVEVADGGIGITAEELPHIFDRFRQADGSSTRRFQGTGLGLSLVKALTDQLDGEVAVESVPGEGSLFRVTLRLMAEDEADAAEAAVEASSAAAGDELEALHRAAALHVSGGEDGEALSPPSPVAAAADEGADDERPRLLVIEDDGGMRRYLKWVMEADGFRVSLAADGERGIELALKERPALILLDLMMPEIDGFEVTRRLRAVASLDNTRIILMTAKEGKQIQVQALEEGADDFVPKPFMLPELRARVRNLVERHQLFHEVEVKNRHLTVTLEELRATEAQLIQSEKLNALGGLAAGLLHEINNPLNYSMMALEMALVEAAEASNGALNEALGDIQDGMDRIHAIVRDLHVFAHPSPEEMRERFSLGAVVESALHFTAHEWKGLAVETAVGEECMVVGSRSHIMQVLINLVTNASKAVNAVERDDGGKIRIGCEISGERAEISVWDNGTGISETVLPRVFDPFFTTRDVGQGMGMGLSICHTIVRNHQGDLRAESVEGEWTRFRLDLPVGR